MPRRDYYNDPDAPAPNRIVVATNAFVQDQQGRVLLIQRSDNGMWALPGGGQDLGETVAQCAERETLEETGYRVRVTGIVGIYSDPAHVIAYDDGEVRQEFALCFHAEVVDGTLRTSSETPSVAWVAADQLDNHQMQPWIRQRVDHGFQQAGNPHIG